MRASRIPAIPAGEKDLVAAINDRMRRLEALTPTTAAVASTSGSGSLVQLVWSVPSTLGIVSVAAPLVSLPASAQPVQLVALLQRAPVGGRVRLQVTAGSTPIGSVTIVEGAVSGVGGSPVLIAAEAVIQVAVLEVGLTFPGSGLTLMARF